MCYIHCYLQSGTLLDAAVINTTVNILPCVTASSSDSLFLPSLLLFLLCIPIYLFRLRPPLPPHSSPLRDRKQLPDRSHRHSSRSSWPAVARANRGGELGCRTLSSSMWWSVWVCGTKKKIERGPEWVYCHILLNPLKKKAFPGGHMKRAPFIDMKKRLFESTCSTEAKENNVPSQKYSSLKSTHNSILSLKSFFGRQRQQHRRFRCAQNRHRARSRCGAKSQRNDKWLRESRAELTGEAGQDAQIEWDKVRRRRTTGGGNIDVP